MVQELLYGDLIHVVSLMNLSLMVQELLYDVLIFVVLWTYLSLFKSYYMVTSSV